MISVTLYIYCRKDDFSKAKEYCYDNCLNAIDVKHLSNAFLFFLTKIDYYNALFAGIPNNLLEGFQFLKSEGANFLTKHKSQSALKFLSFLFGLKDDFRVLSTSTCDDPTLSLYPTKVVFINKQLSCRGKAEARLFFSCDLKLWKLHLSFRLISEAI